MDKRQQIQQEIDNLSNVLGNKTDGTLAMMNKQMSKAVDYFIYNANGEFVKLCKGQKSVEQFCKMKPTQKSLKWVIKKEYLGEKIEVNVVRKQYVKNK